MTKKKTTRIYGDISLKHDADFMLIKGVYGCRNNGEALERIIEIAAPIARKGVSKKK